MKFAHAEILRIAVGRFQTHRLQTLLTLAGLVVGTASVIVMITLGLTGRGFVMSQIEGVGSHLIWATYQGTVNSGVSRTLDDQILQSDADALAGRTDLLAGVTPLVELHASVTVLSRATNLTVLGTTSNYPFVRKNLRMLRGRFLDDDDVAQRARVCVVSRHLYETLFGSEDSGGKSVRALATSFRVIGEFEEPVDTLGQGDVTPDTIFVPTTVAWFFTPTRRVTTLFAEVRDFGRIPAAIAATDDLLRQRHHPGSEYKVDSMTAVIRVARAISFGLLVIFALVAGISVVVGGVGIMNILLASVEQRTREIGLRMSVGARRRDILNQFLAEALLLGLSGSLAGVFLGAGIPLLARSFVRGVEIRLSSLSILFAFIFSCAVTLLFGVFPAVRAASLNPTEALRHE